MDGSHHRSWQLPASQVSVMAGVTSLTLVKGQHQCFILQIVFLTVMLQSRSPAAITLNSLTALKWFRTMPAFLVRIYKGLAGVLRQDGIHHPHPGYITQKIWDCGNGAAGPAIEALVAQLAGEHKTLYTDIDGHFPNHHPNPVDPETLEALRHEVALFNADCGIGFDGDGDRIGVIDAKGRQIAGDFLTAYLGLDILQRKPGSQIIFDVKSSAAAMQLIAEAGGRTELWKTGHSHMKKRLKDTQAPLAGEMSGHIFIQDGYYGFDDALYVASRLTALMAEKKAETGQTITDFMDQLAEQYVSPECRIDCPDDVKFQAMEKMADAFRAEFDDSQLNFIDGVRLTTSSGWCLIRPSNTEGALIARAEASSQEAYDALIEILKRHLSAVNISWDGS